MSFTSAATALTLQDLLRIEDDDSLVETSCPDTSMPLWPQVRLHFFRMLMTDQLYGTTVTGRSITPMSKSRAVGFMGRSLLQNARIRSSGACRADVCIMVDGVANQWRDGRWFNRLTDYFASCRPQNTLTVEDHFEWRWPFPRYIDRVMFHTPQQARSALAGRLLVAAVHRERARAMISFVSRRAYEYYGWRIGEQRERNLSEMLARKAAALPSQYRDYEGWLARIRPKVLMAGVGCYGAAAAVMMTAANRAGVTTAEYQHGAISAGHDAYNFAPALRRSEHYRQTLPQHLLTYGSWWGEQVDAPVNKLVIGNPHREETLARGREASVAKRDVLVLSDGVEFIKYLELAQRIEPVIASRGLRVVLRPHPLERTQVKLMHGSQVGNVVIDGNADMYASLQAAQAVVSEISTGLFEAVGLADRLFMWETAKARFAYPTHPFQSFDCPEQLLEMLTWEGSGQMSVPIEAIWAPSWRERYASFLGRSMSAAAAAGVVDRGGEARPA